MAIYDPETGELKGYRFKFQPPRSIPHRLYAVGTHIVLNLKDVSQPTAIAVSVA